MIVNFLDKINGSGYDEDMEKKYPTPPSRRVLGNEYEQTRREYAKRARSLRKKGYSLRRAAAIIGVSHQSISDWMDKYYPTDKEAEGEL